MQNRVLYYLQKNSFLLPHGSLKNHLHTRHVTLQKTFQHGCAILYPLSWVPDSLQS